MPVATYLESGVLTWIIPIGFLVVVGLYWGLYVRKHPEDY